MTKEAEIAKEDQAPAKPQLDLAFKEGQTIKARNITTHLEYLLHTSPTSLHLS